VVVMKALAAMLVFAFAPAIGVPQESPAFRADTQLVQINVIVRDKSGPVTNLNKGDFVLTDQGKTRTISFFSVQTAARAQADANPPPANTFSNRAPNTADAPAGVTMILLDRLNTFLSTSSSAGEETSIWNGDHALTSAKQHLLKLVDGLEPKDRVAIYSLGESLTVLSDFTGDREQLKTIINRYNATSITSREVVEPNSEHVYHPGEDDSSINGRIDSDRRTLAGIANATRAQRTMTALLAIAAHAAGIPGRKNLVWLTANLPVSGDALARAFSRSNIAIYPVDARGLLPVTRGRNQWDDLANEMSRNPRGTSVLSGSAGDTPRPAGIDEMEIVAQATGGRAFVNTNDLTGAIRTAMEDGAATYTLGFYVDTNSLDGKFHELKLHLKRSGLEVRTQKGYFALKDAPAGNGSASLLAIPITSPLESSGVHLVAKVERTGDDLSISGSIDARDLRLEQSTDSVKGAVEIYLVQQDEAGRQLERRRENLQLQLTPAQYAEYLKSGILFHAVVKQKDGLKTFRIVVADRGSSASGSLIIPLSEIK
jgi:VWFA-related protein